MITLKLTERERGLIRLWIETMREQDGHWGDGAVEFPEERRVEEKLGAPEPSFTRVQLELIIDWAATAAITDDERLLVRRIEEALKQNP